MSQCPEMVKGHLQCGKDTAYDVVHVLRSLDLKDMNQDINYDKMTAVVRYQKPYIVKGRGPFILSFALGDDISLRCVLGLHTLLSIGAANNLLS